MTNVTSNRLVGAVDQGPDSGETTGPKNAARAIPLGLAFSGVVSVAVAVVLAGILIKPQSAPAGVRATHFMARMASPATRLVRTAAA